MIAVLTGKSLFGLLLGLHEPTSEDIDHFVAFVDFYLNECLYLVHDLRLVEYVL